MKLGWSSLMICCMALAAAQRPACDPATVSPPTTPVVDPTPTTTPAATSATPTPTSIAPIAPSATPVVDPTPTTTPAATSATPTPTSPVPTTVVPRTPAPWVDLGGKLFTDLFFDGVNACALVATSTSTSVMYGLPSRAIETWASVNIDDFAVDASRPCVNGVVYGTSPKDPVVFARNLVTKVTQSPRRRRPETLSLDAAVLGKIYRLVVAGNTVFVMGASLELYVTTLNTTTWSLAPLTPVPSASKVYRISSDGNRVCYVSNQASLYCSTLASGLSTWTLLGRPFNSPAVYGDALYALSWATPTMGHLFATTVA
ncbi:hypothetical protein SDRG_15038 [Saprolegnia diclina VS20]|uniref:Uncharacterized protein n=1 Tax=Saprolegnia diclina (strain VS20) TaxID=1156394 RepID=T0RC25_SAPDV|nr:hypothetical protein SDRG_15038 [Saprolegnia diclina VS20]EQC27137.1 hypothetical protein SDRG_15038 [Saprolegnia diclina VS20]|eukprot:XP_008619423.1 hypothetical protein SDRG_15038 [Saprolegnia diclina VS20]